MNEDDKNQFLEAYTNLLVKSWTDEEFSALIDSDPALALSQSGLSVPDGASVVVWRHIASDAPDPSIDGAVDLWELGNTTGTYMMSIPPASEIPGEELSEAELEEIAAGFKLSINGCCCCPCCCCV